MGFDLTNSNGEYMRMNNWGWGNFLQTVHELGWKPMGTEANEYMANPSQMFEYTFWMADKDGQKYGETLSLEQRLTPDQIADIKNNIDEYFDIDTDGFFKQYQ